MKTYARIFAAVTLLLGPYIFATEPALPPYHQYVVRGKITRPFGSSLKNISIVVLAKGGQHSGSETFQILAGRSVQYERAICLTDSTGTFFVVASSDTKADSIAVGVVAPDRPLVVGTPLSLSGVQAAAQTTITTDSEINSGCSGCDSPNQNTRTRVIAYSYYFPDQSVSLNW